MKSIKDFIIESKVINRQINDDLNKNTERFKVEKYPYVFDVDVQFGTFEEMLENAMSISGKRVTIGGSFNKEMSDGKRAAFYNIGVMYKKTDEGEIEATTISISPWEAVYWEDDYFNEHIKQGKFPVIANWTGNTYVEHTDKVDGEWKTWLEKIDSFTY